MANFLFQKIAVLGLGLIGGSFALDVKALHLAKRVVGYNRSANGRRLALKRRACDQVFSDPRLAVEGADLVILATPVQHIPKLAKEISTALQSGAIVTDVGSSKKRLMQELEKVISKHVSLIGGHPIAGTENTGMEAAERHLFKDRWWLLTPGKYASPAARKKLRSLLQALGARVLELSAREHDETLAGISHLPHMIAFALMHTVLSHRKGRALAFAGSSFASGTRVAASSAEMWRDIAMDNRQEILAWIKRFEKSLALIRKQVMRTDGLALQNMLDKISKARRRL